MQIRNFWVDIENSSGAKIGKGPLRTSNFQVTDKLSQAGSFTFTVSASDPNISALAEKRIAVCKYIGLDGSLQTFGGGVIDSITKNIDEDGKLEIEVKGNNLVRELTYRSVGTLDLSGVGGAGVIDGPEQIMALAPAGWAVVNGITDVNVYVGFNGESVLTALASVGEYIGEHWRLGTGRTIEWIGTASSFASSGVRAVQHINNPVSGESVNNVCLITSLEEISDAAELLTRVIPQGAGNGGVMLTLANVTDSAPSGYTLNVGSNYVKRNDSETTYGRIERTLEFKDIKPISNTTADLQAASNMLLKACVEHLRKFGAPQKFYKLSLGQVNQLLRPGTTLHAVYRVLVDGVVKYDLNGVFNIIQVDNEITPAGVHTASVIVSTIDRLPRNDADFIASTVQASRVVATHQQLGASVDTFTYRDEMDNSKGASFRFWTGDEYTSIQRAVMRFRIQSLRSTVKSVAGQSTTTSSGGGSTSGSGGGSTQTSSSGGSSSPTSGTENSNHSHGLSVDSGSITYDVGLNSFGKLVASGGWGGATVVAIQNNSSHHTHDVTIPAHTHSVSIPSHTHSTPDHTHNLTPNISMQYGIFEEGAGNTLSLGDLVIRLNGGSDLSSSVSNIGGGWYELDITDELVDSAFRPTQESNEISISTSTAKTARIEAQITLRGVVQAVAYS